VFEGLSGEGEVAGRRGSGVSGGNPHAVGFDRGRKEIQVLRCRACGSFSCILFADDHVRYPHRLAQICPDAPAAFHLKHREGKFTLLPSKRSPPFPERATSTPRLQTPFPPSRSLFPFPASLITHLPPPPPLHISKFSRNDAHRTFDGLKNVLCRPMPCPILSHPIPSTSPLLFLYTAVIYTSPLLSIPSPSSHFFAPTPLRA
jgi:hypothetical protein